MSIILTNDVPPSSLCGTKAKVPALRRYVADPSYRLTPARLPTSRHIRHLGLSASPGTLGAEKRFPSQSMPSRLIPGATGNAGQLRAISLPMSRLKRNTAFLLVGLGEVLRNAGVSLLRESHPAFASNEDLDRQVSGTNGSGFKIRTRP